MRDYLTISSVPYGEPCAQVGSDNYDRNSRLECVAFIGQIRRELGDEPNGAVLRAKSFPHEFGSYREVVVVYDDNYDDAVEYAFKIEANAPEFWDETALKELKEGGYTLEKEGEHEANNA